MNKTLSIFFLLFTFGTIQSQIRIDTIGQQVFKTIDKDEVIEFVPESRVQLEDEHLNAIKEVFRTFDFEGKEAYFTKVMWSERNSLLKVLNRFSKSFEKSEKVGFFEHGNTSKTERSIVGIARFHAKEADIGILRIMYTYHNSGGHWQVSSVVLSHNGEIIDEYPKLFGELSIKLKHLDEVEANGSLEDKIVFYNIFLPYLESKLHLVDGYLKQPKNSISGFYGSLSWYNNVQGDGVSAVRNSTLGLKHDPTNVWINTNLALGYLHQGKLDQAKEIYTKCKDIPFRGKTLKSMMLDDLNEMDSKGFVLFGKEEIYNILQE